MKKHIKIAVCTACILLCLLASCVLASAAADIRNITVAETAHGNVKLEKSGDGDVRITLQPDKGYLTASVKLKTADGQCLKLAETDMPNVYTCAIPETGATLAVDFRYTELTLCKEELAMNAGKTAWVPAKLTYLDGEPYTRGPVKNDRIVFTSSDPAVVSVDPATGKLTAHRMGYARITASACAGTGVDDYFYVIVDGDKDKVVGTLQLNAWFEEKVAIEQFLLGHSFLVFTNTSGEDITIDVSQMYGCHIPTAKYAEIINTYDGVGYDPATFYYVTRGAAAADENDNARKAWADELFTTTSRGKLQTYTIKPDEMVTFDNTGDIILEELMGDMQDILDRYGNFFDEAEMQRQIQNGELTLCGYVSRLNRFLIELSYDLHTGYNPVNGVADHGGETLNHALYSQAYHRDYRKAVGCKVPVTRVQLMAMVDCVQYDTHFNILDDNCTTSAAVGWNLATAATPRYHMEINRGGITSALSAPMWLRRDIVVQSVKLAWDKNIQFVMGIGVVKP